MTRFRVVAATAALALTAYCGTQSIGVAVASAVDENCAPGSEEGSCLAALEESNPGKKSGGLFGGLSFGHVSSFFSSFRQDETTLPQNPKADTDGRKKELEASQKLYRWNFEGIPVGLPFLDGFPPEDEFPTVSYLATFIPIVIRTLLGAVRGDIGAGEIIEAFSSAERAAAFSGRIGNMIKDAKGDERALEIDDFVDLHAFPIKTPDSVQDFDDDDAFARQRLQGGNCVAIEKCTAATRAKLKILDSDPSYKSLKTKVDTLMAAGKLFVVDHELLKGMEASPLDGTTVRYLTPSVALFEVVDDELLPIKPIAIQLSQGETATPIFTPDEGYTWKIAKSCFEAADFIIHEVVSHLTNTHVVMEVAMVTLHRQLPKAHPLHVLLLPHTEGTAFINWGAQVRLIVEGGGVDRLQGNKIQDSWTMVVEQALKRISKEFSPDVDLADRQMTKEDFPGRYPYRDIGLKYWAITQTWVKDYVDLYYENDADLAADYELQAFVDELINTAQVVWLKDMASSKDKKALLCKLLSSLIYSASTLHAAVNFPQKAIMAFSPNTPGAVYAKPPADKAERTLEDFMSYLPPLEIATTQAIVGNILGSVIHTKLGDYESGHFSDKRVNEPLAKFQQAIEAIETDIVDDNAYVVAAWRARGKDKKEAANFGYTILLPDNVPQSINI